MSKTVQESAHERLSQLAAEVVEKDPNPQSASITIAARLTKRDRELLIDECVASALQLQAWRANGRANHLAKHMDRSVELDTQANRTLARAAASFLDTITFGGVRLGDMTGLDLDAQIRTSRAHAAGHTRNAMLLSTLRKKVGDDEKVRQKWTDQQAIRVNDNLQKIEAA